MGAGPELGPGSGERLPQPCGRLSSHTAPRAQLEDVGAPCRAPRVAAEAGAGRRPRWGLGPGGARAAVAAADL